MKSCRRIRDLGSTYAKNQLMFWPNNKDQSSWRRTIGLKYYCIDKNK